MKHSLKKHMPYGQFAKSEEDVSCFVPYTRHVDATTLQTKDGYLLKTIQVDGMAFETADQHDLNHHKNIKATMLRGLASSRFALYHHIIRREIKETQNSGTFDNEWCAALDRAYQKRLEQKRLYINEQYITLIYRPPQKASRILGMIEDRITAKSSNLNQDIQEALKTINETAENMMATLAPYGPALLGIKESDAGTFSENLSFLSALLNFEKTDLRLPSMDLAKYLPRKRISFGSESLEIRGAAPEDVKCGAILSLKEYTDTTAPGTLDALLRLPCEFILTQSFGFVNRQAGLHAMRDTKRKLIAGEDGAISLEEELDEAIDDLSSGRTSFGEHHLTITVTSRNKKELSRSLSACNGVLVNLGLVAVREDINLEPAFWAQLPGNFSFIARRSLISSKNFAGFASLHNFPSGKKNGSHWGAAITRLETTSGTPYWFNFHDRDVGNFTLIGPTGTGKTVLLTFLNAQAQRLKPNTVYFDKDRGAEIYLRAIGADYTVVKSGRPTGLNPLKLPDTPENRAFIREWLKLLVSMDSVKALSPKDSEIIADAVNANFEQPVKHRRLHFLAELLAGHEPDHDHSLAARMAMWHGSGERAWLFDNPEDILSLDNANIGFDLTSILDDRTSRTPWLMYIFHRIEQLLKGQKTIIMLDEGWKMLDDPVFAGRIKDWMKTIRKQNGLIGFATQSARDALGSSVGDAIIEQSPTQIFLPNARASQTDYCKGFGLSRHEWEIIKNLTPQSRCFLLRHGKESVIARLDLSGMDDFIKVLSGRTGNIALMHDLTSKYGPQPANWLPYFLDGEKTQ